MNSWTLIEFSSRSCVPCRVMKPLVEELKREYPDEVTVYDVDELDGQRAADKYNIRSIPAFILEDSNGVIRKTHIGTLTREDLRLFATL